eukprot:gb/GECG01008181.1/.p1 GENE.gb/GECG01008181.1/~~gb/GECG01008181.1/.p1  ORF type:complete len:1024 (+),score=197.47 gb/GECG01008181.1/:1-3072(+)
MPPGPPQRPQWGQVRDPLDQDFHEFKGNDHWDFVQRLWGARATFLRFGEVLTFLRPILDGENLVEVDVYSILMAAASEAQEYVFYPTDVPKEDIPASYTRNYIRANLRAFRQSIFHPDEEEEGNGAGAEFDPVQEALSGQENYVDEDLPTVVSTHQLPDMFLRLAQRKYPKSEEALENFLNDIQQTAIPRYEAYLEERKVIRRKHWRKGVWRAKNEAEKKREAIRERKRREEAEKSLGAFSSVRRRTQSTREEARAPLEIPKVTGTIYGLDDGNWYLLDNGEVAVENRPSFLKHLLDEQETVEEEAKSEADSVKTEPQPEDWDSDGSEKDAYGSDDDGYIGFQRRSNTKQVMCVVSDYMENIQTLFDKLKSPQANVVYFETLRDVLAGINIAGTCIEMDSLKLTYLQAQQHYRVYHLGYKEQSRAMRMASTENVIAEQTPNAEQDEPLSRSIEELQEYSQHNSLVLEQYSPSTDDRGICLPEMLEFLVRTADACFLSDLKGRIAERTQDVDKGRRNLVVGIIDNALNSNPAKQNDDESEGNIPLKKKMERLQKAMVEFLSKPTSYQSTRGNKGKARRRTMKGKGAKLPATDPLHMKLMILFSLLGLSRHEVTVRDLYESALISASHTVSTELKAAAEAEYEAEKAIAEVQYSREKAKQEAGSKQQRAKSGSGGTGDKGGDNAQQQKEEENEEAAAAEKVRRKVPNLVRVGYNANVAFPSWGSYANTGKPGRPQSAGGTSASSTRSPSPQQFDVQEQMEETKKQLTNSAENRKTYENIGVGFGTHIPVYKEVKPPPKKPKPQKKKGGSSGGKGKGASKGDTQDEEPSHPWIWNDSSADRRVEFRMDQKRTLDAYDEDAVTKHVNNIASSATKKGGKKSKKKASQGQSFLPPASGTLGDEYGVIRSPSVDKLTDTSAMHVGANMSGKTTAPVSSIAAKVNARERERQEKARKQKYAREMAKYKKDLKAIEEVEEEVEQERAEIQKKYKNNPEQMPELPQLPQRPPMPERPKTPPMEEKTPPDFFY